MDSDSGASESTVASSYTASEIHHLQNKILQQSKQIEQFIATADESESSFRVLKTLFSLFKSELSVNLSLRKRLVDQRKGFESASSSIDHFLQQVHELGYENIDDLAFVFTVLQSQLKKLRRIRRVRRAAAQEIRDSEAIAEQLHVQKAENSVLVASLNTQLSRAQTEVADLRQQLNESESRMCDLKTMLNCSEVERRKLETSRGDSETMRRRIAQFEQERQSFIAKYSAKKGGWSQRVISAEEKVEELTTHITELQSSFAQEIDDIHAQY
jgi:chromosome segregation ATPase